jgi:hypothetical protein
MSRFAGALIAAVLVIASSSVQAQLQPPRGLPGSPQPTDPYQALSFFEGNWTIAGLPAGTRFDESCTWLGGMRRHLVCRSRTESANGVREGLGVFSYRAADGTYVYRSYDPNGEVDVLEGRPLGEGWQFNSASGSGTAQRRTRITITPAGERSFTFAEETSVGGGAWQSQPPLRYVPSPTTNSSLR